MTDTNHVIIALGGTMFAEELKGDFRLAVERADAAVVGQDGTPTHVDALIDRATVHVMQGELRRATTVLNDALALCHGDARGTLRVTTHLLHAMHMQYNAFPDGGGVGAVEVSSRWRGAADLLPLDTQWQQAMRDNTDPTVQLEAWLVYAFESQLQPSRFTLDSSRYAPTSQSVGQLLEIAVSRAVTLYETATSLQRPRLAAYADWAAADLTRRAGDRGAARALLDRAQATWHAAGDDAGVALCRMTAADWQCAPCSSPLYWNLAVVDSSAPSSSLSVQVEGREGSGGEHVSYADAMAGFQRAGAMRGVAAVELRNGYLATRRDAFDDAAACATRARDHYAACGDQRGEQLASTHLLMCELSGAGQGLDVTALATSIGAWGKESGSISHALGLGILVNRLSRHWLLRHGHYERAMACSAAAQALFDALGAEINAVQCRVDQGLIRKAVGERSAALTFFERALDEYDDLVGARPLVAENLKQRLVLLATDVYMLALQDTDADGMKRAAARLEQQLETLPHAADVELAMAAIAAQMTAVQSGGLPDLPDDLLTMSVLAPLAQMAASVVRQASVLGPLYRSRAIRREGYADIADQWLSRAEDCLEGAPDGERQFLLATIQAEREEYADAAASMRLYLNAGGANAGFAGKLTELMQSAGGEHGSAEAALQERRTHEQAFSAFVMVHEYTDALTHYTALERLGGAEWWKDDAKPWQPLCDSAEMFEALGDMARARRCYDQAIGELEKRRAFLSRDELKVALASDKGAQYLYFLAARAAVRDGDAAAGFDYAERGKSRALLDLMAAARRTGAEGESLVMQQWRERNMQLVVLRGLLAQARAAREREQGRITALEAQVAGVEVALRESQQHLERENPRFHEAISTTAPLMCAADVSRAMPPGTLLLEYFFLGRDLLIWAVSSAGVVAAYQASLDTAMLSQRIRTMHESCAALEDCEMVGEGLSRVLLQPFASQIMHAKDLMIVPHGAAHLLPFHALPFDGAPLGNRRAVSYLPSASTLQWLPEPTSSKPGDRILVVGNPTLDLPSSEQEATFVAAQFSNASLLIGADATEAAVRAEIAGATLLHFATHGTLDERAPLNSCVALAAGEQLSVYELMLLRLQARLVVLSACSTAKGGMTGGDDVVGLTRSLLAAGAKGAVVSLWEVDDESTALLMQEFYARMRSGSTPRRALQAAQVHLQQLTEEQIAARTSGTHKRARSRADDSWGDEPAAQDTVDAQPGFQHPYFWAPFMLVGR